MIRFPNQINADAELLSNAIDEAMARFSFNGGSGPESNANFRGCQPYQAGQPQRPSGVYRGGPAPPLPTEVKKQEPTSIDPQQIIAQILSNKNRMEMCGGGGGGGGSSSNNSSSSRTGISSNRNKSNEHCDMTLQSEYENVRPPMRLPPPLNAQAVPSVVPGENEGHTVSGNRGGGGGGGAGGAGGRRRLGRQESRYTSGKVLLSARTHPPQRL